MHFVLFDIDGTLIGGGAGGREALEAAFAEVFDLPDVPDVQGKVSFSGIGKDVCLSCVPDVEIGDYVVVHVGFAISKVDEVEAKRTFEVLKEMSQLDELEWIEEIADQSLQPFEGKAR